MALKRFYLRFIGKDSVAMAKWFQIDSFFMQSGPRFPVLAPNWWKHYLFLVWLANSDSDFCALRPPTLAAMCELKCMQLKTAKRTAGNVLFLKMGKWR